MAVLLKSNNNIKSIDISHNAFTALGFESLFDSIASGAGKQLESLDLSYNDLGNSGILALSRALEINHLPNLKHLKLRSIGASPAGLAKLLSSFQGGCKLEVFDLSGNNLLQQKKKKKKPSIKNIAPILKNVLQGTLTTSVKSFDKIVGEIKKHTKGKENKKRIPVARRIGNSAKRDTKTGLNRKSSITKHKSRKSEEVGKVNDQLDHKTIKDVAKALYTFVTSASHSLKRFSICSTGLNDDVCEAFVKLASKKKTISSDDNHDISICSSSPSSTSNLMVIDGYLNDATDGKFRDMQTAILKVQQQQQSD